MLRLGYHGAVVIVGRGAQFLLPPACALRVRLVAPLAQRVKRVAEQQELTMEAARIRVKEFDTARTTFIRKVFKANADSPLIYDLVVNTGEIGLNAAVEIVSAALREKLGTLPLEAGHLDKMSVTKTTCNALSAGAKTGAAAGQTKEEQLIALFMELNGASESQARAVYGYLDAERPAQMPAVEKAQGASQS